jgi:protein SCO1/2
MRGFYLIHVATGVILITMLVAVYNLRDETIGRSGVADGGASWVIERAEITARSPTAILPPRSDDAPLTFTNHLGAKVSESDFLGRYSLIFFGYSSCPDVCPGNLVTMSRALTNLGDEAELVQPIFVSFDPARDTPEVLKKYVAHFHPRLIGLTGTAAEIEAATRAYGVYFELGNSADGDASGGDIQHTSNTFLIGPDGGALTIFRHNTDPEEMAAAIRAVIAETKARGSTALP